MEIQSDAIYGKPSKDAVSKLYSMGYEAYLIDESGDLIKEGAKSKVADILDSKEIINDNVIFKKNL